MKLTFFIVAFLFLTALFGYVLTRSLQVLPHGVFRSAFGWIFAALFVLMFAGIFLDHTLPQSISSILTGIGYTFMLTAIYMMISYAVVDWVRIFHHFRPFTSDKLFAFRQVTALVSLGIVVVVLGYGSWKFNHPEVTKLDIEIGKPLQKKEMTLVLASDLHLGNGIGKRHLQKYVQLINEQKPDLVVLAGDLTDRSLGPVRQQNMVEDLRRLKAPLGVYAIRGNHEYYSGSPEDIALYLQEAGITLLLDSSVLIDNSFYLIGRDDKTNPARSSLAQLVHGLNREKPFLLADHQPYHLEEAEQNGIDLQLSGHTHNGQFFPGNLLEKAMFECAYGYHRRGNTHYYVSSGLGIWGPLYRIGTRSEVVRITIWY